MSRNAHLEVDKFLSDEASAEVQVCRVVVQKARDVSLALAEQTGIQHESPQVLLFRDGECVWNASHRKITAKNLEQTIKDK